VTEVPEPMQFEPAACAASGRPRVLVNGVESARISPFDRGLHFGDGLFETIACHGGRPRFLALHLGRLMQGCARLRIPFRDLPAVRAEIEALAAESERSIIKLLITRGEAAGRGYAIENLDKAMRITIRYAWPHESAAHGQDGVKVRTLAMRLGENPLLAGLKHCNRLEQVLGRAELAGTDAAEGILFSSSGRLVSGTMTNVFIVRSSSLQTPLMDRCGVAGVMRRVILREAARSGMATHEQVLHAEDLHAADEIFLSNARVGIWPVCAVDERPLVPGPLTRRLQELMRPLLEEPRDA